MVAPDFSGAHWHKSTRSHGGGGACVMVAHVSHATSVKDSKLGEGSPVVSFSSGAWAAFLRDVQAGDHDQR